MKLTKGAELMAIVMEIDHGPGKGKSYIDDSFVVKTQAEVDDILRVCQRVYAESVLRRINEQEQKNKDKQKA